MGYAFQYFGASKHPYTFLLQNPAQPDALPWQGGLVAFAKFAPEPLYFEEAHVLHRLLPNHKVWLEVERMDGPTLLYFLVENDEKARRTILADLIEAYRPPLNVRANQE